MCMNKKRYCSKISGLSLLEALISTAIVGIGFAAILQMTNYSVQSIYSSGERTKANYLTNVIVEYLLGHKEVQVTGNDNFSDFLAQNQFNSEFCRQQTDATRNNGDIYGGDAQNNFQIKTRKWEALLNNQDYLNCRGNNETRNFRVFKIGSRWSQENNILVNPLQTDINNDGNPDEPYVMDEVMYIGRVQMNLNDGRKRKFLYFQTDYELKQ